MKRLQVNINELPVVVEVNGEQGQQKLYLLDRAGKKFGAFLRGIESSLLKFFRNRSK